MKKKLISLLIATTLTLSLTACGSSSETAASKEDNSSVVEVGPGNESKAADKAEAAAVEEPETDDKAASEEDRIYGLGDVWSVKDKFSLVITGVKETEERNSYADEDPAAVYIVDYMYTNDGIVDSVTNGLYIAVDDMIVDADGEMGYTYYNSIDRYACDAPVGTLCRAQEDIGVNNPGEFTLKVRVWDENYDCYQADFVLNPDEEPVEVTLESTAKQTDEVLTIGDTWTVDDQWKLTVTGVTEVEERNEFTDYTPAAVYRVDYTYENLGYTSSYSDGLFINLDDLIVDVNNEIGYGYPLTVSSNPKETPIGAKCKAQTMIGVDHPGTFRIYFHKYDGEDVAQRQVFEIPVK
ncbi:MAG: hypothetical protein Q4B85_12385 [Lachnospiraceae bacterium]|nr:hypothetical protein [Lachnospiraceae bacterium]